MMQMTSRLTQTLRGTKKSVQNPKSQTLNETDKRVERGTEDSENADAMLGNGANGLDENGVDELEKQFRKSNLGEGKAESENGSSRSTSTSDSFQNANGGQRLEDLRGIEGVLAALDCSALDPNSKIEMSVNNLPYNWIEGMDFNRDDALKRWKQSLEWRRDHEVESILNRPQPKFFIIKNLWPQFFLGTDKEGNLVTLERFKDIDSICKQLKQKGVTPDEFADHCVFLNEYWIKNKISSYGKLVKMMDVDGLAVGFNVNLVLRYFGNMNSAMQMYPEILNKSYFVNVEKAGTAFRMLFKLLPRFLEKRTFTKINQIKLHHDSSGVKNSPLLDLIDAKFLPVDLGGEFAQHERNLPIEVEIAEYVRKLNSKFNVVAPEDWKA